MKTPAKVMVVLGVLAAAAGIIVLKPAPVSSAAAGAVTDAKPPRLLDLGADKCVPCKMMAPTLADLKPCPLP
jgi:thioredoxin 1